jgi:predicted nuclease of predicted toxin-antitoxin system
VTLVRILLDHCVDWRLARSLPTHDVKSARDMGWQALRNGALLSAASREFDCVVTVDQNVKHQQNLATLPVSVTVLVTPRNRLADLLPLVPALEAALASLPPRTLVEVSSRQSSPNSTEGRSRLAR